MHICGIQKNGTDEPTSSVGRNRGTDVENRCVDVGVEGEWEALGDWS